jgi:hypothetical protein
MVRIRKNWRIWALALLVSGGLIVGYHYVTGTAFYQYLETVNPDNHRH